MSSLQDSDEVEVPPDRALRHGLAKKLAAFAFISAFVTCLAVTWAAIDLTQRSLNEIIQREVPSSLRRVAQRQVRWIRSGERKLLTLGSKLADSTRSGAGEPNSVTIPLDKARLRQFSCESNVQPARTNPMEKAGAQKDEHRRLRGLWQRIGR